MSTTAEARGPPAAPACIDDLSDELVLRLFSKVDDFRSRIGLHVVCKAWNGVLQQPR